MRTAGLILALGAVAFAGEAEEERERLRHQAEKLERKIEKLEEAIRLKKERMAAEEARLRAERGRRLKAELDAAARRQAELEAEQKRARAAEERRRTERRRHAEQRERLHAALRSLGQAIELLQVAGRHDEACEALAAMEEPQFRAWETVCRGLREMAAGGGGRGEARQAAVRSLSKQLRGEDAAFKAGLLEAALGEPDRALADFRAARPLFWDEALALRYWRIEALEELRAHGRLTPLVDELDRSWGVR